MKKFAIVSLALAAAFAIVPAASADPVTWTKWGSDTGTGTTSVGTATGTLGGITVTYSGQTSGLGIQWAAAVGSSYPGKSSTTWVPTSSYVGGDVSNAPPTNYNLVAMEGGSNLPESITFSSPVINPFIAIWSLGQTGDTASFVFSNPFTIEACGPSTEYGGRCITESGDSVLGTEGNGVIQLSGTYSSIGFTTPGYENWYGFTVGATPEPSSLFLLGTGLLGLGLLVRRQLAS
jgi:hypothetical protein